MKLKDYMAKDVITSHPDTTVSQAVHLMSEHQIHRLPVVKDGQLVGLVTEAIIAENSASSATSLSIYEMNYLLSKTSLADIMDKKPVTVTQEMLIEEAAVLMVDQNLMELTVIDKNKEVVGMITYKDIFKALIDLTGYQQDGARFIVYLKNDRPGELEGVTKILTETETNISILFVNRLSEDIEVTIQITESDASAAVATLRSRGYQVEAYQ